VITRNEESLDERRRERIAGCALHTKQKRLGLMAGGSRFSFFSFAFLLCNPVAKTYDFA
jgi:hypothetical protein